jgi:single-stranded-DNA-specific exonuclease
MPDFTQWHLQPIVELPKDFLETVRRFVPDTSGRYLAQLLWQRGIRNLEQLPGFLNPKQYQPTPPSAFGEEMERAIARLKQAYEKGEKIAIWGDFDADGVTATAVLWEGLGAFFPQGERLTYVIPNRLTDSHGLAIAGLDTLATERYSLVVTCDTGSTNQTEIEFAGDRGLDVIITDHHTLLSERPSVSAIINPRSLPADHPLASLSGVAVAFKLVEALYAALPEVPTRPLEGLLDLVAIGLIADLVELKGDCRYLAQMGIERLQLNQTQNPPPRPGIAKLLEFCKRSGDRPTDISFGIGPRINAISRIHGDASFAVELLTSSDPQRCQKLAEETELANARRKSLQKEVAQQVSDRLAQLDLSTTLAIVLADPQWSVGVLGLVAGQIAQEYGRPTILLTMEGDMARGSARSVNQLDLYQLLKTQEHLLHRFGGHPFAAGMSLPAENVPLLLEGLNRQLRQRGQDLTASVLRIDLTVTVSELGAGLFRELKRLEPCGIGNPPPRLLIQHCWFSEVGNRNIKDFRGQKLRYIKTEFRVNDETGDGFPGVWWGHYRDEIPTGRCDAVVELDFNAYQKRYEIRLVALQPSTVGLSLPTPPWGNLGESTSADWLLDWRTQSPLNPDLAVLTIVQCPRSWDELQVWLRQAVQENRRVAIAYPPPPCPHPLEVWQTLVGIAKYLSNTRQAVAKERLLERLEIGDQPLQIGLHCLGQVGFQIQLTDQGYKIEQQTDAEGVNQEQVIIPFVQAVREEQFRRQYFYTVPLTTLRAMAGCL